MRNPCVKFLLDMSTCQEDILVLPENLLALLQITTNLNEKPCGPKLLIRKTPCEVLIT